MENTTEEYVGLIYTMDFTYFISYKNTRTSASLISKTREPHPSEIKDLLKLLCQQASKKEGTTFVPYDVECEIRWNRYIPRFSFIVKLYRIYEAKNKQEDNSYNVNIRYKNKNSHDFTMLYTI
jgi:hypothetical protein